jgi:hypothetical protein
MIYYMLDGGTPETVMKGHTAGISQICEFGWCDWVMFCDTPAAQCPDDGMVLGRYRYLRPTHRHWANDDGQDLTANDKYVP